MTQKQKPDERNEVIMCTDDTGMQLYLSEKAANKLSWVLAGLMAALVMPVITLAFMCI